MKTGNTTGRSMNKLNLRHFSRALIFIVLGGMIFWTFHSCRKTENEPASESKEVRMGAILDLSGNYSEEGLNGKAAIELALADLNAIHQMAGSGTRFLVSFTDTKMDTLLTQKAARSFFKQGITLLVAGPNNSTELKSIKPIVDQNHMLSLCCFSSSQSLAIEGDYIFRLITSDNAQGQALLRMMSYDSLEALIILWRDDTYGNGLQDIVQKGFASSGGAVYEGIHYEAGYNDYTGLTQQLSDQVAQAVAVHGAGRVGVLLISYQEASGFLSAASDISLLSKVRWYGCDANVQKASVTLDPMAAGFAAKVRFVAPIMGIGTAGSMPEPAATLSDRIRNITGSTPDAYALSAYDAVMIMGRCFDLAGRYDTEKLREVLPWVCSQYNGLGIRRTLNDAGDLNSANYIFWAVESISGGWTWAPCATWYSEGDYIKIK
jgi:branched-chain amino acid transport system substrate-binding protein